MSLKCPKCNEKLFRSLSSRKTETDKALNTYTRPRHCSCGYKTVTVEMFQDDLNELRRKAFLFNLSEAKA